MLERKIRSIVKACSWFLLGVFVLIVISFFTTRSVKQVCVITILYYFIRFVSFYVHERLWLRIKWGKTDGLVIWFTGLPCSGKTTLAIALQKKLIKLGYKVERLDGDIIRKTPLSSDLSFTKEDREKHLRRIGVLAHFLSKNGIIVLCSFVSPYRKIRKELRQFVHNFVEVYVKCSKKECIRRDVKGLWKKALKGEIQHFTGVSDIYEHPIKPDVTVDTEHTSVEECVNKIYKALKRKKLL